MTRCQVCGHFPHATCEHCGGPACRRDDECQGCHRVICAACDTRPTPAFSYPGDAYQHPHNERREPRVLCGPRWPVDEAAR
jgi:hypothetical protein